MEYKSRITNIGASKIAEAIIKGETINLVSIAAGDGGGEPYEPTGSETKLKNEVWRGKITGVEEDCTNGNAYNLITTIPQSAEGFFIRELAAYDSEGDCIAIANTPTIEKKGASTGVGIELTVNMQLIFENADQVNVVIAPLATKEITNRIGNTTDTGGSTTSGTVMGKLNKVLENEEGSKTNTEALKNDIASVKENVSSVKSDVAGVKADVSNVKTSVTAVSNKIGTATDTGGSSTTGTVMGKLNKSIDNISGVGMDVKSLEKLVTGEASPYGTGAWGDVEYEPNTFSWGSKDAYGRYVIQCKSLHIPTGVTMTPPEKCNGVYILCQGEITIDGTIDLRDKRLDATGSFSLAATLVVDGKEYALANGGDTVVGGPGGRGGDYSDYKGVVNTTNNHAGDGGVPTKTICGSVVGGGISSRGLGGTGVYYNGNGSTTTNGTNGSTQFGTEAAGALILIANGKVILNGTIIASASDGIVATSGTDAKNRSSDDYAIYDAGDGGNGALAPSGGGPITIICTVFTNNGIINTKGMQFTSVTGTDGEDFLGSYSYNYGYKGGKGGKGGIFTSCAGEIKVYETGEAA